MTTPEQPQKPENNEAPAYGTPKRKGWLKSVFNRHSMTDAAISAAVSFTLKTCVLACTASLAAPLIKLAVISAACGLATNYTRHVLSNRRAKKEGREPVAYSFKKAAMGASFGVLGGALGYGAGELFHHFFSAPVCVDKLAHVAPKPTAPVIVDHTTMTQHIVTPDKPLAIAPTTAPVQPCDPLAALREFAAHHHVSEQVQSALTRSQSTNPRVAAQALKDIAMMRYNGVGGMDKCIEQAMELYKESAAMGNIQAKVDLAYIHFHGNAAAGIAADHADGIKEMAKLSPHSHHARELLNAWTHPDAPALHTAPFHTTPPGAVKVPDCTKICAPVHTVTPTPAPVPAAAPVAPSGLHCATHLAPGTDKVSLTCTTNAADTSFHVGDSVTVMRPGLLPQVK